MILLDLLSFAVADRVIGLELPEIHLRFNDSMGAHLMVLALGN